MRGQVQSRRSDPLCSRSVRMAVLSPCEPPPQSEVSARARHRPRDDETYLFGSPVVHPVWKKQRHTFRVAAPCCGIWLLMAVLSDRADETNKVEAETEKPKAQRELTGLEFEQLAQIKVTTVSRTEEKLI